MRQTLARQLISFATPMIKGALACLLLSGAVLAEEAPEPVATGGDDLAPGTAVEQPPASAWDPAICPISFIEESEYPDPVVGYPTGTVILDADRTELIQEGTSLLEGDVLVRRDREFVEGERLEFNPDTGELRSVEPARFGDGSLLLDAAAIEYNTNTGTGRFLDVSFLLPDRPAQGSADVLNRISETESELESVGYTTCPPGEEDWMMRASSISIDQESGRGTAWNSRLSFMGVPFFYFPWLQFPIDDRRMTGFLFPTFGYSDLRGDWLHVPFYVNLASNYDLTLAPLFTKKRGNRVDAQFRYLTGLGSGQLTTEYIERDRITDETRYRGRLRHVTRLGREWRTTFDLNKVSDPSYMQDFSESGRINTISYIRSSAGISGVGFDYSAGIQFQQYEQIDPTVDPSRGPYELWPAMDYSWNPLPYWGWLDTALEIDSTNFRREQSIEGWRHHAEPAIAIDLGTPGIQVRPRFALARTEYDLIDATDSEVDYSRSIPVSSIDTRLLFERSLESGATQTLEPRLFLLSVPYRDQDSIPRFDTRGPTPSLSNLFQHNRFNGLDRYGDTRQATVALASNFYDAESSRRFLGMRIGQAFYFEDRRVGLSSASPDLTESVSDVYAEVQYLPSEGSEFRIASSWDDREQKVQTGSVQYGYKSAGDAALNLAYTFRRDIRSSIDSEEPLQQASFSFYLPVTANWKLFGKTEYSIAGEQSLHNIAGIEYESCCWAFRVMNRRYIFNRDGEFNQALWFQLSLKGMASVGRRADKFLESEIRGYGESDDSEEDEHDDYF